MTRTEALPTPDAPRVAVAADATVRGLSTALAEQHGMTTAVLPEEWGLSDLLVAETVPDCVVVADPDDADAVRRAIDRPTVVYADLEDAAVAALTGSQGIDYVPAAADTDDRDLLAARVRDLAESYWRREELSLRAAAMDQADVGITIADMDHPDEALVYANEGFVEMTGYALDETIGRNCRFLQGPGTDEAAVDEIRSALEAEASVSVDLLNYRADGEPFWNQLDLTPVANEDGAVTHYLGFQKDVTERKRLADRLERENERLSSFASVVSHDLRNPLSVAQGGVDIARSATADPRAVEELDDVEASLDRIEALIEGLLDLARQGAIVDDPEPTSVATTVTRAWSTVEAPTATIDLDDDLGTVGADPERLRTLFENLFRNAVDHAAQDVRIHVGATPDGFYVADDGPGIPPDEREDVFEQGYTTDEDGTGLGLTIVRSIADAHGWSVAVESGADGGARFVFGGVETA